MIMATKKANERVYRVSYLPPYREVDDSQYTTLQAYLSDVALQGGSAEKRLVKDIVRRLNPHILIDRETGIPSMKKTRQEFRTPIITLLSYFFGLNMQGAEGKSPDRPPDSAEFLQLLKQLRFPSTFLTMKINK